MLVSPGNLKRYLGIPELSSGLSGIRSYDCGWDHLSMEKQGERVTLISEPYGIGESNIMELLRLCEDFNLELLIDGRSSHNPGACIRIMLWRKDVNNNTES